jgi:hypothetical protein
MSYKAHAFVVAVISIGLGVGHVSPLSAAVLSYEQTAAGRTGNGQATSYLSLPSTDTYSRSFNSPTAQIGVHPADAASYLGNRPTGVPP